MSAPLITFTSTHTHTHKNSVLPRRVAAPPMSRSRSLAPLSRCNIHETGLAAVLSATLAAARCCSRVAHGVLKSEGDLKAVQAGCWPSAAPAQITQRMGFPTCSDSESYYQLLPMELWVEWPHISLSYLRGSDESSEVNPLYFQKKQ